MVKKNVVTVTLALMVIFLGIHAVQAQVVTIPDPNLEAALRQELNIDPAIPITTDVLENLDSLTADSQNITDLRGIEYCKNVRGLVFAKNRISDLAPLKELVSLEGLHLGDNYIEDIAPLQGLINLQFLVLDNNYISECKKKGNSSSLRDYM